MKNLTTSLTSSISILFFIAIVVITPTQAAPIEIQFLHSADKNSSKSKVAQQFKQLLESRVSPDAVRVTLKANKGDLAEEQIIPAVLRGQFHIAMPDINKVTVYNKRFQLFNLPFLFVTPEAAQRFTKGVYGERMLSLLGAQGIKGLGYHYHGMKQMLANRIMTVPSMAEGLKFRTNGSQVANAQSYSLKAQPIQIGAGNVFPALENNTVDAQENVWTTIHANRYYQFHSHVMETNHGYSGSLVMSSKRFWDSLPGQLRIEIETALQEAIEYGNWSAKEATDKARSAIVNNNAAIIHPVIGAARDSWMAVMLPIWSQFEDEIGSALITAASSQR